MTIDNISYMSTTHRIDKSTPVHPPTILWEREGPISHRYRLVKCIDVLDKAGNKMERLTLEYCMRDAMDEPSWREVRLENNCVKEVLLELWAESLTDNSQVDNSQDLSTQAMPPALPLPRGAEIHRDKLKL